MGAQWNLMMEELERIKPRPGRPKPAHVLLSEVDALAARLGITLDDDPPRELQHGAPRVFRGIEFGESMVQDMRRPVGPAHQDRMRHLEAPEPAAAPTRPAPLKTVERKEIPMVAIAPKDQHVLASEVIVAAKKAHPQMSDVEAVSEYMAANPAAYEAYRVASKPSHVPDAAPKPLTLAEAERQFTANPKQRGAASDVAEARAKALMAKESQLSFGEAVARVFREDPVLYERHRVDAARH